MADEPQILRGINWREVMPFTHIFRAFRIAVHPSKLVLGLAVVLCLYFGGRIMDGLWLRQYRAVPGEVDLHERATSPAEFREARMAARRSLGLPYAQLLQQVAKVKANEGAEWKTLAEDFAAAKSAAEAGKYLGDVRYWVRWQRGELAKTAQDIYDKIANKDDGAYDRLRRAKQAAYAEAAGRLAVVDGVEGRGLFLVFLDYQRVQVRKVVEGVVSGNWLGGLRRNGGADGVYRSAIRFFTAAPAWAIQTHPVYFVAYGVLFLVVWSLFGGAIARIAAVHVADEGRKLSMRQGLSFAVSKFLSFLSAPLIPAVIVGGIGLIVAIASGLTFAVHFLDWAIGALYFLALAAGFVMTLVVLGTAGGLNLMYPTIAVEGSDSFDAISRSFSYVYGKPWRMLFYSSVAVGYGAVCYLFVRLFLWLVLLLAHISVGLLVFRDTESMSALWPAMQPPPTGMEFPRDADFESLSPYGGVTAGLLSVWVQLVIGMLGAFAVSFYVSVSTIIYYLVRRDMDATEMDDVYLEQPEEDFAEAGVSGGSDAGGEKGGGSGAASLEETMAPPSESERGPTPG